MYVFLLLICLLGAMLPAYQLMAMVELHLLFLFLQLHVSLAPSMEPTTLMVKCFNQLQTVNAEYGKSRMHIFLSKDKSLHPLAKAFFKGDH